MKRVFFVCIFVFLFLAMAMPLRADQLDDVTKQLEDLKKTFSDINKANQTNETQLQGLQNKLDAIKAQVAVLERQIEIKQGQVIEGEKAFAVQQNLLNQRAKSYYKNMGKNSFSIVNLLLSENISESLQNYFYQKTIVDEDKKAIIRIALFIKQVEDKKKALEIESAQLASVKADVDKQSQFLAGEVAKSRKYLGELQSKIVQLSAQQQSIIAGRQAGLNIPRSAGTAMGGCVDDRDKDPGFSPRFALFTFGVPNRVGLSQYGAFGRSKANQSAEEILSAYYSNYELKKDYNQDININVENGPSLKIDEYLYHLGEMPEAWGNQGGFEALKAQAVAARSYALAYTNNGQGSICGTDHCQVFLANEKGGRWNEAVNATKGWVMVQGGNPIKAWFSSTHGGYILSTGEIGWSGTSWTKHGSDTRENVSSIEDLRDSGKAYDKESPWFYCDWGARGDAKTAWLRSDEIADIANVIMLWQCNASTVDNLYQPDKPNPVGKDTWDQNKVKEELKKCGGNPFNSVSDVSVSASVSDGRTNNVTVNGDAGSKNFDAANFKSFFNLRAPANIQIVGPLFNVEKR